ncbi:tetratricopeptide repeat protein [Dactylosporangium sp. AC04546]|uniref:tetratricopeptide repeat protein n=1 Tax=Dactylosporangium sp. AC04546 TaxID=2862460 RepID=UPI001EE10BC8|nr:tetratricopeptide repeat protein [Dactylosporangium sp. AC04546]WVK87707.1 tetratricopeptide repeat protein [Dactylosporangium sp. AC04546]
MWTGALRLWRRAVRTFAEGVGDQGGGRYATAALLALSESEYRLGNFTRAEAALTEALRIRTAIFGPDHREVAALTEDLAAVKSTHRPSGLSQDRPRG